jgi:carboxymethylenebutenolidase
MLRRTDSYEGLLAETVSIPAVDFSWIHAYSARPLGEGPFPGIVLFHHRPGWDEWYRHATRIFAHHGYMAICPDLYCRVGHGEPDDVAARAQAEGGIADGQVVEDAAAAISYLRAQPTLNGRVGLFGTCSGGRHAYLAACRAAETDALVNCWGGKVVADEASLTDPQPVAPVDYTSSLTCPVLGLFGNDDRNPSPEEVDALEVALQTHGKDYEFHRYDGAGHGFFYHDRPAAYRAKQAVDGWGKLWDFLDRNLR